MHSHDILTVPFNAHDDLTLVSKASRTRRRRDSWTTRARLYPLKPRATTTAIPNLWHYLLSAAMRSSCLFFAVALSPAAVLAYPKFTTPAGGANLGTGSVTIEWEDSGSPSIDDLSTYTLQLIVGGNTADDSVSGPRHEHQGQEKHEEAKG